MTRRFRTVLATLALAAIAGSCLAAQDIDYDPARPAALRPCDDAQYRGRTDEARRCYTGLTSSNDRAVRAEAQWANGDLTGANETFRELLANNGGSVRARTRWGRLFLAAHQYSEAQRTLGEALERAPEDPQARLAMARLLAERFDSEARPLLDDLLKKDDTLIEGHLLRARLQLENGNREPAREDAQRALALAEQQSRPPLEPQTLLAAIELQGNADPQKPIAAAQAYNPRYGRIFAELAHFELMRRRYREANVWLERAVQTEPTLWNAHEELGVNYLRLGDREKARASLVRAYEGDPFSATTVNTLRLLDSLEQYDFRKVSSPDFVMQLHRKEADMLAPYVESLTRRAIAQFGQRYGYTPRQPITVEIYPDHDDFAVRTAGLPGIGLLGVTFGHVVAMDSPSGRATGDFHWGSTLWHELAHVFTLSATDHRVPRWLSEGISVFEEWRFGPTPGVSINPRPLQQFAQGKLLPVADLDEGFIRPTYPDQVQVSYSQAGLTCLFIEQKWGFETLAKLLHQFDRETTTAAAITGATGLSPEDFDKAFADFLRQRFAAFLGSPDRFVQLSREAGQAWEAKDYPKAARAAREATRLLPEFTEGNSPWLLAARAQQETNDKSGALETLLAWRNAGGWDPDATRLLARLLDETGRGAEALPVLESVNYGDPLRAAGHRELGERLLAQKRGPDAQREFGVLLAIEPQDAATAQFGLARASQLEGDATATRRHLLQSLEIAPTYRPAQKLLLEVTKEPSP